MNQYRCGRMPGVPLPSIDDHVPGRSSHPTPRPPLLSIHAASRSLTHAMLLLTLAASLAAAAAQVRALRGGARRNGRVRTRARRGALSRGSAHHRQAAQVRSRASGRGCSCRQLCPLALLRAAAARSRRRVSAARPYETRSCRRLAAPAAYCVPHLLPPRRAVSYCAAARVVPSWGARVAAVEACGRASRWMVQPDTSARFPRSAISTDGHAFPLSHLDRRPPLRSPTLLTRP